MENGLSLALIEDQRGGYCNSLGKQKHQLRAGCWQQKWEKCSGLDGCEFKPQDLFLRYTEIIGGGGGDRGIGGAPQLGARTTG